MSKTHISPPDRDMRVPEIVRCWERANNVMPPSNPTDPADPSTNLATLAAIATAKWWKAHDLEEQFDALRHAAGDFVTAYRAASMSDEEGLLMAIDPDAMRQLWHRVDEAATDVEQAL